ncbi:MAG: hypothetical protein V2J10_08730 [Wenzhouxiangella sp.]|jgi:predicted small lipoprotein YifL|nr:hypothetical protein [Wenzhouxiangella sp.]
MLSILPRLGLALLVAALAAGCGLKDDLYLPEPGAQEAGTDSAGTASGRDEDHDEADS